MHFCLTWQPERTRHVQNCSTCVSSLHTDDILLSSPHPSNTKGPPSRVRSISVASCPAPHFPLESVSPRRELTLKVSRIFSSFQIFLKEPNMFNNTISSDIRSWFLLSPQPHGDWKEAFTGMMPASPCMFCDIRIALHPNWHHNTPSLLLFYNW